jgi:diguanylate cyclase (GGDEF)-like protein/putative nucleotidyltransferase with HDIG domain
VGKLSLYLTPEEMKYLKLSNYSRGTKIAVAASSFVLCTAACTAYFGGYIAPVFAVILAVFIVAYRVHVRRLTIKAAQLENANRVHISTVEALATAIDARDQIGSGHVRRTQIYSIGLGKALNLSESELDALKTAALLHDIGKLAVPDFILSKTGRLTDSEFDKTKIHSTVGASILDTIDFGCPVADTVRSHHENWDGTGYPSGLKGDEIPLTARILSIADAYDSMRCARRYRDALPREDARKELLAGVGIQFDEKLVHAFLKHLTALEQEIDAAGVAYPKLETGMSTAPSKHLYIDQIKQANKEVFTLFELSREFAGATKIDETLSLFTSKIKEFIPFTTCSVFLLDDSAKFADAVHVVGENADKLLLRRIRVGEGATGFALLKLELVKNVNPDLDFSLSPIEFSDEYLTMATIPLIAGEELIGAVSVYSKELSYFEDEHIRLLETVSKIAADAIARSKNHDEATTHALTDTMTGLPNARSLQMQFDREVSRSERGGGNFQVLMLDLDGFKGVNDNFGHKAGDRLLHEIGQVILGQLREYDFLARYGGDEFAALISDASTAEVMDLCDRIETAVRSFELKMDDGRSASVGVSLGAASFKGDGASFDEMIIEADKAMYQRKSRRKIVTEGIRVYETQNIPMSDLLETEESFIPSEYNSAENLIVELDDSHVLQSSAVH